jgi:hypothetical protein
MAGLFAHDSWNSGVGKLGHFKMLKSYQRNACRVTDWHGARKDLSTKWRGLGGVNKRTSPGSFP